MDHRYYTVDKVLSDLVRTVLVLDNSRGDEPGKLPLFTNGVPALVCRIGREHHQLSLFGRSITDDYLRPQEDTFIIFLFHPFALGPLFKLSAQQLNGDPIELDRWNPQMILALNLQLGHAISIRDKIAVLTKFILSQVTVNSYELRIIKQTTDRLLQNPSAEPLSALCKELNLTERTFQRIFKKYVGITPNEYRRICQFRMAFFQLKGGHYDKLADVAYTNGYFDQSHYIRSFKEFVDTTPNEYLQFGLKNK